jgi:glycosyltransferase involved in cell wall biosynthesis
MSVEHLKNGDLVPKPPEPKAEEEIIAGWGQSLDQPLVSILCITYNHAPYIEDALNGFLMQETNFPFEIWVHDDASTDETRFIIERYRKEYPRIVNVVFQEDNQYSKGNRPTRFLKVLFKGKYCALCEGDDYWLSTSKLSQQVELLEERQDIYLSIHPAYVFDVSRGEFKKSYEHDAGSGSILPVNDAVSSSSQFSPTASYLFRADQFKTMPSWFFYAQDLPFGDYFIETILGRNGIIYISDIYCVYRRNVAGSYTHRTAVSSDDYLVSRMEAVLKYTEKVGELEQISKSAIEIRRKNIVTDYQSMALNRNSFSLYRKVANHESMIGHSIGFFNDISSKNKFLFQLNRFSKKLISLFKRFVVLVKNKDLMT